ERPLELVDMPDLAVVEDLAVARADELVDADMRLASIVEVDGKRLDARVDLGPLPRPVAAHGFAAVLGAAFPTVRPLDTGREVRQHLVHVARIEGPVEVHQHLPSAIVL